MSTEEQKILEESFKQGYLLAEYEPAIAGQIATATGDSTYLKGFKTGLEQYNNDRFDSLNLNWQNKGKDQTDIMPDKSLEKGKDDLEPGL